MYDHAPYNDRYIPNLWVINPCEYMLTNQSLIAHPQGKHSYLLTITVIFYQSYTNSNSSTIPI